MTDYTILKGNSAYTTRDMPDNSVHLVFTSPPYYNIKQYNEDNVGREIGLKQSLESYHNYPLNNL